ncbi:MAG: hypothetical protein JXR80_07765 [Deltaproteobacteria bacterium]|nr:hypothetical protein [Deltaproteobacteria bacterium]
MKRLGFFLLFFAAIYAGVGPVSAASVFPPSCSTTGPLPPPGVEPPRVTFDRRAIVGETEIAIPAYNWRHGCGPTAVGMVIGYWDGHGYPELYPGDASTQTAEVDQLIASGGEINAPNPAGHEGNCEDYCLPNDEVGALQTDAYITAGRVPHADNSIADWMFTSRSTYPCGASLGQKYGWSCSNAISDAFVSYVNSRCDSYTPSSNEYFWRDDTGADWDGNWNILKAEIDGGRPMVFLVDSNGDGGTDHFVAIVGYRLNDGHYEYACKDTWNVATRWERLREMSNAYGWGVGYAYSFSLVNGDGDGKWYVDTAYVGVEEGTKLKPFNTLLEAVTAASPGNWIYVKGGLIDYSVTVDKAVYLGTY